MKQHHLKKSLIIGACVFFLNAPFALAKKPIEWLTYPIDNELTEEQKALDPTPTIEGTVLESCFDGYEGEFEDIDFTIYTGTLENYDKYVVPIQYPKDYDIGPGLWVDEEIRAVLAEISYRDGLPPNLRLPNGRGKAPKDYVHFGLHLTGIKLSSQKNGLDVGEYKPIELSVTKPIRYQKTEEDFNGLKRLVYLDTLEDGALIPVKSRFDFFYLDDDHGKDIHFVRCAALTAFPNPNCTLFTHHGPFELWIRYTRKMAHMWPRALVMAKAFAECVFPSEFSKTSQE